MILQGLDLAPLAGIIRASDLTSVLGKWLKPRARDRSCILVRLACLLVLVMLLSWTLTVFSKEYKQCR